MAPVIRFLAILLAVVMLAGCRPTSDNLPGVPSADAERQRLVSGLLEKIPPGASMSVQSNLMAHVGPRGAPYLFPVVGDAEYVLTDVTASQDPVVASGLRQKVQELLDSGQFGVIDAADGLVLLRRGLPGQNQLPDRFYDFLRAKADQQGFVIRARFGDDLELVAYDYETSGGGLVRLATYWRALRPLDDQYKLVFFLASTAGWQPEPYEDGSLAALWYPPAMWQAGELVKVEFAPASFNPDISSVRAVVYQQEQQVRLAIPAVLQGGTAPEGAVQVLDLAQTPVKKVPLADFIGLPFDSVASSRPGTGQTPIPPANPPVAISLCGKPLDDPSQANLRPVAVKIDNAPGARPQTGLDAACVVYEHMAEGGITRFTAIYHTEETDVGPIRSARRVDMHIMPQYQALFSHVGGAPAEMEMIKSLGLLDVDQFFNSGSYYYSRQRSAPHNVYTSVSAIRTAGERLGYGLEAELERFPYDGTASDAGDPVTDIVIPYNSVSQSAFRYDSQSGDYVRYTDGQPHIDAATGRAVRASTLVIQRVPIWVASYSEDALGAASYDFDLIGEGRATVFRDGRAIEGKWVRDSLEGWTNYYDDQDQPIPLVPGKVWIALLSPEDHVIVR